MKQGCSMITYFSQIVGVPVEWLWYPYIPYGKITLIEGDPGDGKSSLVLSIAAMISRGGLRPDGTNHEKPESTIYQCDEDGINDTILPRLKANNADCSKIAFIDEDENNPLSLMDERIEEALKKTNARLLVFDPIQSFLGSEDMQNVTAMRRQLFYISRLAMKYHCAVIFIGHMNKQSSQKSIYRSLGSIDIVAACRSVLAVRRMQQSSGIRYIQHIKSSLAEEGSDLAFEIAEGGQINIIGTVDAEVEDPMLEKESIRTTKQEAIEEYLIAWLSKEDLPAAEIMKRFRELGISNRTVKSVKADQKIKSIKKKDGWYWHLDSEANVPDLETGDRNGKKQEISKSIEKESDPGTVQPEG